MGSIHMARLCEGGKLLHAQNWYTFIFPFLKGDVGDTIEVVHFLMPISGTVLKAD